MPRAKSTSAATGAASKKRRGRSPKGAAAKSTTVAKKTGRPAKAKQTISETDGRRVPVAPATNRAVGAAEKVIANLKNERQALAAAQSAASDARDKARATGAKTDKTAAKKARVKVERVTARVAKARATVREAKARVVELKARDLLNARLNNVNVGLEQAEALASERITTKLERAVEKFRSTEHAKLVRAEGKKAKQRKLAAEQRIAKLHKDFDGKVQAAQESLQPKPRKKRKRRAKRT